MSGQACISQAPWLLPRGQRATGRYEGVAVRDGFFLALTEHDYLENASYQDVAGDYLKINFKLAGRSFIRGEAQEECAVEAGAMSFLVQPPGSLKLERVDASTSERSLTLVCSRDFISNILAASAANLPPPVREYLHAQVTRFTCASMPMLPQARSIVEDILMCPLANPVSRLMMEARSLELLCLTIQQLQNTSASAVMLRAKDRRKVEQLCELLQSREGPLLTLRELSQRLVWNETQMMECFKQVTGMTIANYRHRLRMDRAMRQLRETDDSIIEIASSAGYDHASNFATAFRRTFGYPPASVRKSPGRRSVAAFQALALGHRRRTGLIIRSS